MGLGKPTIFSSTNLFNKNCKKISKNPKKAATATETPITRSVKRVVFLRVGQLTWRISPRASLR